MYLHERKKWPKFSWNSERVVELLIEFRYTQGQFLGGMESIGLKRREESMLQTLTQDVIKTSEIEGEILDADSVRSSVARHLGIEHAALKPSDRYVDGIVEVVLDATGKFAEPLTSKRLFAWHNMLFSSGHSGYSKIDAGTWRKGPVQVVSGRIGREVVHFEGPAAKRLDHEMSLFLDFVNNEEKLDPVLKSALAHLWFVTIHPFEDGNGRIGRAVGDMLLARSENSPCRFYSLSSQIQAERKDYYAILEKTQKGDLEVTEWIEWFFGCLSRAIEKARGSSKTFCWDEPLNKRQRLVLGEFQGKLTTSKWAKMTKCSQDTAYRDIMDLVHRNILVKSQEGGRSTSYTLNVSD